jgi:hypothetical protein
MITIVLASAACGQSGSSGAGSAAPATPPPRADAAVVARDAPAADAASTAPAGDGADAVAKLVVHDVGSKALGSQTIEASCVAVLVVPAEKWTVAAAHLTTCGDKTARSLVWLFKRAGNGAWTEDYAGQPPTCWKGVPADLRQAVVTATHIPGC